MVVYKKKIWPGHSLWGRRDGVEAWLVCGEHPQELPKFQLYLGANREPCKEPIRKILGKRQPPKIGCLLLFTLCGTCEVLGGYKVLLWAVGTICQHVFWDFNKMKCNGFTVFIVDFRCIILRGVVFIYWTSKGLLYDSCYIYILGSRCVFLQHMFNISSYLER